MDMDIDHERVPVYQIDVLLFYIGYNNNQIKSFLFILIIYKAGKEAVLISVLIPTLLRFYFVLLISA